MKNHKQFLRTALLALATLTASAPLLAQAATEMAEGEIRKIDKEQQKLTIKHGEIKNLDMPGMTMAFKVQPPALIERVKVGDKVRFRAEKAAGGGYVVTELQPAGG